MLVDKINYVHIENAETSKEVWNSLKVAFQNSGLTRHAGLLRQLITKSFASCESTEEYVNKIDLMAHQLKEVNMPVKDEWIDKLLLAGLPEEYSPMIMGIESSGIKISCNSIKTKMLQDCNKNITASFAGKNKKRNNNNKKGPRCYYGTRFDHISTEEKKSKKREHGCLGFFPIC